MGVDRRRAPLRLGFCLVHAWEITTHVGYTSVPTKPSPARAPRPAPVVLGNTVSGKATTATPGMGARRPHPPAASHARDLWAPAIGKLGSPNGGETPKIGAATIPLPPAPAVAYHGNGVADIPGSRGAGGTSWCEPCGQTSRAQRGSKQSRKVKRAGSAEGRSAWSSWEFKPQLVAAKAAGRAAHYAGSGRTTVTPKRANITKMAIAAASGDPPPFVWSAGEAPAAPFDTVEFKSGNADLTVPRPAHILVDWAVSAQPARDSILDLRDIDRLRPPPFRTVALILKNLLAENQFDSDSVIARRTSYS